MNDHRTFKVLLGVWLLSMASIQVKGQEPFAPLPDTISPQAKKYMQSRPDPSKTELWPAPDDFAGWKKLWQQGEDANVQNVEFVLKRYRPTVVERKLGGVPVLDIKPRGWKENGKILVHAHGGGYVLNSARTRLQSSVPAADATGLRVISIDYTVAPRGKWRQVIGEVVAVIQALQKEGYRLKDIALLGESAGGGMAAGAVLKMRDEGLGMPAAVVLWSPWSDITNRGDSAITLKNFDPAHVYDKQLKRAADAYAKPAEQKHPYVSPVYGDYSKGFPPTLIQGGTREIFLSHFVRHYRAIDSAGGIAVLDLYEGMPHIFQIRPQLAETVETRTLLSKMGRFLDQHWDSR